MGDLSNIIKSALLGVAVGDALGVPVEYIKREELEDNPVTDMIGYGTYNLPPGTWSDDSSLTFCLAEALTNEFDLNTIGQNFIKWYKDNLWTARGNVFDIGEITKKAIKNLEKGVKPEKAGLISENSNGNGSLMRILPLVFYIFNKPVEERFSITAKVSSITHGHIRSVIACFYYLEFARYIILGKDRFETYKLLQQEVPYFLKSQSIDLEEIAQFSRLLESNISAIPKKQISSSGYVLHALEASIWCLLNTDNYKKAVLKAVNLGEDTDTTAAVTGGLAGLVFGLDSIPKKWLKQIARYEDIISLSERLAERLRVNIR